MRWLFQEVYYVPFLWGLGIELIYDSWHYDQLVIAFGPARFVFLR